MYVVTRKGEVKTGAIDGSQEPGVKTVICTPGLYTWLRTAAQLMCQRPDQSRKKGTFHYLLW